MRRVAGVLGFLVLTKLLRRVARSKLVTAVCYVILSDWVLTHRPKRIRR